MPIVRVGMAIRSLAPGQELDVVATDPAFEADLRAWSSKVGHPIISFSRGDVQQATIRKVGVS